MLRRLQLACALAGARVGAARALRASLRRRALASAPLGGALLGEADVFRHRHAVPRRAWPRAGDLELHAAQRDERAGYQYDDVDSLVALGALDADGKRVGAVKMSAGARARFDSALLDVACGVVGG